MNTSPAFKIWSRILSFLFITFLIFNCEELDFNENPPFVMSDDSIRFAVIGDYGKSGDAEFQVSEMVKNWKPDFIITTGDNNYEYGLLSMMEENISQYYGDFIYNYDAPKNLRCDGYAFEDRVNRFFPAPGNHDYGEDNSLRPYLTYFTLPGKEEYYEFIWGPVHFFSINSMMYIDSELFAEQKSWFKQRIRQSDSPFKIAYFHHSPYSTGPHGNNSTMQWEFDKMGVTAVITGHNHVYERIRKTGDPAVLYFVNGTGGKTLHSCGTNPLNQAKFDVVCYDENFGAMFVTATRLNITFSYHSIDDQYTFVDSSNVQIN